MSDKAANIVTAIVAGATVVYLGWHVCRAQAVKAAPIAGVTKALTEAQAEANLEPPIAEWQQAIYDDMAESQKAKKKKKNYVYSSESTLNKKNGVFYGPSGKESYYNLPMAGVVRRMKLEGHDLTYWVRKDGVKMFGDYVMVAADLRIRPKGTILQTSLGEAMVCDTGSFARYDSTALDVAVAW